MIVCGECKTFPCRHSMACCVSRIGPTCQHQTEPGAPSKPSDKSTRKGGRSR